MRVEFYKLANRLRAVESGSDQTPLTKDQLTRDIATYHQVLENEIHLAGHVAQEDYDLQEKNERRASLFLLFAFVIGLILSLLGKLGGANIERQSD